MTEMPELIAWMGEDQFAPGEIGIRSAIVPAGTIPIVALASKLARLTEPDIVVQLQCMADSFGKPIRLVRYAPVEELRTIVPRGRG